MIKDEKQYEYTQYLAGELKKSITAMEKDEAAKINAPQRWEINRSALQSQLDKLEAEIAEYENLASHDSHRPIVLTLDDIYYLPQFLIKSRIAAKLSQKGLADLAGLTEEQYFYPSLEASVEAKLPC
jgi:hypothetical protein